MFQIPALKPTAVTDLTTWYYQTAPAFAAAYVRCDWETIAQLDMMEAALIARDEASMQYEAETGVPLSLLTAPETEEDGDDREWCAAFDLDTHD